MLPHQNIKDQIGQIIVSIILLILKTHYRESSHFTKVLSLLREVENLMSGMSGKLKNS
jgi:hypothetical protein